MKSSKLRILYVPNESGSFRQIGFRRPLTDLAANNLVESVSVFSLQWRIRNGGDPEQHRQDLIEHVRNYQPNFVLMQHLGKTGLTKTHFKAMRAASDYEFVYHEADPYSRVLHPLPRSAREAGASADITFTVGSGVFAENFRRYGAKEVRWASHVFDPERYGRTAVSTEGHRSHDIVVVANRNQPRFRGHPNWRDRIAFVGHLQERFGDRVAIYGNGWTGVGAMGPVDPLIQDTAIRSAWISANWDHYAKEPNYFSNRLPISLASGSIHATSYHPGYSSLFPNETRDFLKFGETCRSLGDAIERVLTETSVDARIAAGIKAREFAHKYYRQDNQLVEFLNYRAIRVDPVAAAQVWNIDTPYITEV